MSEQAIPPLLLFYRKSCPHTKRAQEHLSKLEKEESIKVVQLDVTETKEAREMYDYLAYQKCAGVPFFVNLESGESLCGVPAQYEAIKNWSKHENKY